MDFYPNYIKVKTTSFSANFERYESLFPQRYLWTLVSKGKKLRTLHQHTCFLFI